MKFFLFTGLLWICAMFHLWEHRRFERDLRLLEAGEAMAAGDWRPVALPKGAAGLALKRAFAIRDRMDIFRYAAPVLIFCLWLLLLRSWGLAFAYAAIVAVKWFCVTTVWERADAYYLYICGRRFFTGRLDADAA